MADSTVHQYNAGHWNMKYQCEIVTKQHALQRDGSSCGVYAILQLTSIIIMFESHRQPKAT